MEPPEFILPPALLDHRSLPLLARRQYLVLRSVHLRLHDVGLSADEEPHLPTEFLRLQHAAGFAPVFCHHELLAESIGEETP